MNTYLLYCRFQKMRGGFSEAEYEREIACVRETLAGIDEPHWREYLGPGPTSRRRRSPRLTRQRAGLARGRLADRPAASSP